MNEGKKDTNALTPTSAKKCSPPSASKPQPKRINMNKTETEDSESDSSLDESSTETAPIKNPITLSSELVLLKDVL